MDHEMLKLFGTIIEFLEKNQKFFNGLSKEAFFTTIGMICDSYMESHEGFNTSRELMALSEISKKVEEKMKAVDWLN